MHRNREWRSKQTAVKHPEIAGGGWSPARRRALRTVALLSTPCLRWTTSPHGGCAPSTGGCHGSFFWRPGCGNVQAPALATAQTSIHLAGLAKRTSKEAWAGLTLRGGTFRLAGALQRARFRGCRHRLAARRRSGWRWPHPGPTAPCCPWRSSNPRSRP